MDDAYIILSCVVLFTGLRAAAMEYVLAPLAKLQGITNRKNLTRFSEQAWLLCYYIVFWPLGVVSTLGTFYTRVRLTNHVVPLLPWNSLLEHEGTLDRLA